ncbi:hypothetical protein GCM10009096_07260 [Parasphingorhabdus litoris]|uniref:Uncharacterized protein n=1 Tax=Parasphingorhabdus litoris TaxID=394733 RepID=A0ABP3K2A9_9SPHN|nr:hypothetical protein [Parasphingorhabdus litoris]
MFAQFSIFARKHRVSFSIIWHIALLLLCLIAADPLELLSSQSKEIIRLIYMVLTVPLVLRIAFLMVEIGPASRGYISDLFEDFSLTEKELARHHFLTAMEKSSRGIVSNKQAMDIYEIVTFAQSTNEVPIKSISDQQVEAIAAMVSGSQRSSNRPSLKKAVGTAKASRRGRPRSSLTDQLHCKISTEVKESLRESAESTGVPYGVIVDETLREYFAAQDASPA